MFRFEVDDRVLHLVIDRAAKRNALLPQALPQAQQTLVDRVAEGAFCAVVLRGMGGFFCAGYDMGAIPDQAAADGRMVGELDDFVAALAALPVPTLALVDGGAFGAGFELALACDMRLTTRDARWCMPPARLGLLYSLAGMCRLQRAVGEQRAHYLLTTAAEIDGRCAAQWGLAFEVLEDGQALEAAGDALLNRWRQVNRSSACAAKSLLVQAAHTLEPALVARSEALRAELFARAEVPSKP